jgi:membrane protein
VLIFLYMVGVIFIIGAELNAALLKFRVRAIFAHNFLSGQGTSGQGAKASKPDKVADIGR